MNGVDVQDFKTVVRMLQLGAHDLNPVRPTLAFPFFWKRKFSYQGKTGSRPRIAFESFSPD